MAVHVDELTFKNMRSSGCSAIQSCSAVHFPMPPLAAKRVHLPSSLASMVFVVPERCLDDGVCSGRY